jgi:hypothetical protein
MLTIRGLSYRFGTLLPKTSFDPRLREGQTAVSKGLLRSAKQRIGTRGGMNQWQLQDYIQLMICAPHSPFPTAERFSRDVAPQRRSSGRAFPSSRTEECLQSKPRG